MSGAQILSKLRTLLKSKFRKCVFRLKIDTFASTGNYTSDRSEIIIEIMSGDFDVFKDIHPSGVANVHVKISKKFGGHVFGIADNLDPDAVASASLDHQLADDAVRVFKSIVRIIKDNFKGIDHTGFYIDISNNYKNINKIDSAPGVIAKPTKIDHKTFKGRRRRGVVEAIIDRVNIY